MKVSMPTGSMHGWGVAGTYLEREIAKLPHSFTRYLPMAVRNSGGQSVVWAEMKGLTCDGAARQFHYIATKLANRAELARMQGA